MKFASWNVNGLRACIGKGFEAYFRGEDADVFCIQETKLQAGQTDFRPEGYRCYWNYAEKKGYSGTAVFSKKEPLSVSYGIGREEFDGEGRAITLEFPEYHLVCAYAPNSREELKRLSFRLEWEDAFLSYALGLDRTKPVVVCGDLNVAHQPIDLKNPAQNRRSAGFSDEERACFSRFLKSGFVDTFRYLYPGREGAYTWWSYLFRARERNAGWRIDYFLVSERLKGSIVDSEIRSQVLGSDHCPVTLTIL